MHNGGPKHQMADETAAADKIVLRYCSSYSCMRAGLTIVAMSTCMYVCMHLLLLHYMLQLIAVASCINLNLLACSFALYVSLVDTSDMIS